jgi:signal transduction histidine kinase/DNA-binding response OmpR family regulator/HPt (histidine-containing phosphotransfer) domain-containing protein
MRISRHRSWVRRTVGLSALAILLFSAVVANRIHALDRESVQAQLTSTLASTANLLHILEKNHLEATAEIVRDPELLRLMRELAERPQDAAVRSSIDGWVRPQQTKFGFQFFSIYNADAVIVASHDPAFIGAKSTLLTRAPELKVKGFVVSPPFRAKNTSRQSAIEGKRDYFQLTCRTIVDRNVVLGYFCLGSDPRTLLYPLLKSSWSGRTGEAMLIDRNGRLHTPSRFDADIEGDPEAYEDRQASRLYTRVPTPRTTPSGKLPLPTQHDPLTQMAQALVSSRSGRTGFMDGYVDYRNVPVVGEGQWIDELNLGLIVEIDEAEAYRASHFAAFWVWGLGGGAIALLILLAIRDARARRELAISEAQLASFFSNAPMSMNIQASDGRFLKTNPYFQEIAPRIGIFLDADGYEIGNSENHHLRERERGDVMREHKTLHLERTYFEATGESRHSHVVRFPITVPGIDAPIAVGTMGVDITESVKAREELQRLTEQLESEVAAQTIQLVHARDAAEAAGRAKAEFLANMSHEIRTPLNAIVGMSHLADRLNADPKIAHYLQRIDAASAHLLGIVNNILDFSKIEADKIELELAPFSVEHILDDVTALIGPKAAEKGLELLLVVDAGVPGRLVGDAMRIGQVLINFAANAVKFTGEGFVEMRATCVAHGDSDALLRFEVEDSGGGIPADKLALLFQPFTQADNSRSRSHEGTGLGLAISKRLAELMNGRVGGTSRPGFGSTFFLELRLPIAADVAPQAPARFGPGVRALVVDDNERSAAHTQSMLFELGMDVDIESSGNRAIDRIVQSDARDYPYRIVLVDTDLERGDFASRLAALSLRASLPAVVRVAAPGGGEHASDNDASQAVLRKPILLSRLGDTLVTILSPKADSHAMPAAVLAQATPQLKGLRVLLVEDNEINREVATDLLGVEGIDVTSACDGMQALRMLRDRRFDLVLMDLHMPVMDGIEATRAIRKDVHLAQLPVVGLSASVQPADKARALAAGMNAFVGKPIVPRELFEAIEKWSGTRIVVAGRDHATPAATGPQDNERLVAAIRASRVTDVDHAIGMLLGRAELYAKLVRKVVQDRACETDPLRAAITEGRIVDAARTVHNLGSIAGSLGAMSIRQGCLALESELRGECASQERIDAVCDSVDALRRALVSALDETATAVS